MKDEGKQKGGYQTMTDTLSRFTVSISRDIYDVLEERAQAEKRTKSYFIEEALKQYFSSPVFGPGKSITHQEESKNIQDLEKALKQVQFEIRNVGVTASTQYEELQKSFQMQIDALRQETASTPQDIISPPASHKHQTASIQIGSIEEIQPDVNYPVNEASIILDKFSKNPLSTDALRMRCKRGVKSENLKPEDIGYHAADGFYIKGSYLLYKLKSESVQNSL